MLASKLNCLNADVPKFCCETTEQKNLVEHIQLDSERSSELSGPSPRLQPKRCGRAAGDEDADVQCGARDNEFANDYGTRDAPAQVHPRQTSVQREHEVIQLIEATVPEPAPLLANSSAPPPILETSTDSLRYPYNLVSSGTSQLVLNAETLQRLEKLVADLAGSPMGCIDFARVFTSRQKAGQILALRDASLEGMTFGEACQTFYRVTVLGLKEQSGNVVWGPDSSLEISKSDKLLVMSCTPGVLAMGLSSGAKSLSEVNVHPDRLSLPLSPGGPFSQAHPDTTPRSNCSRSCCG